LLGWGSWGSLGSWFSFCWLGLRSNSWSDGSASGELLSSSSVDVALSVSTGESANENSLHLTAAFSPGSSSSSVHDASSSTSHESLEDSGSHWRSDSLCLTLGPGFVSLSPGGASQVSTVESADNSGLWSIWVEASSPSLVASSESLTSSSSFDESSNDSSHNSLVGNTLGESSSSSSEDSTS